MKRKVVTMEALYLKKASELCNHCMDIGRTLEQVAITQNAAEALEQLSVNPGLRVAVVASSHANARAVIGEILGADAAALIPKLNTAESASIRYSYGEVPEGTVCEAKDDHTPIRVPVLSANPLLEKMELLVYISRKGFTDFNWKKELSAADFVFLTVSATQLFNQSEKSFLQTCVQKYVGAARFTAIMADTEMINSEEAYNNLQGAMAWHLSSQGMCTDYYEIGGESLLTFISENLLDNTEKLHQIATEHISAMCCDETKVMLEDMLKEADSNEEALFAALEDLKNRARKMRSNGSIAANMAYGDISGTLTYNATQGIHSFFSQLNEEVAQTLEKSEDVPVPLELIPDYLRTSLKSYDENLQKSLQADAEALNERLTQRMTTDAGEFLSGSLDVLTDLVPDFALDNPITVDFTLPENQTKQKAERISKALLIGSIPMFLLSGFTAAAGTLVASQLVKKMMQEKVMLEDKNNALDAVHSMCSNLEQEMTQQIRQSLKQLACETEKEVQDAYAGFVAAIMTLVQDKLATIEHAKAHRAQVEELLQGLQNIRE